MLPAHDSESLIDVRHATLECVERLLATARDLDSSIARAREQLAHSRKTVQQGVHLIYSWNELRSWRQRLPGRRPATPRGVRAPSVHVRVA